MERAAAATRIMESFGERTGLTSDAPPRRYLWTDAFAVCNCLALHRHTGEARWSEQAGRLVEQVHRVLGRHRPDDPRSGWISGLGEEEGARHPTAGGLRIGKPLPERGPFEPPDERLEWERDGQYYHYLTRWMHALARAAEVLGEPELLRHGAALAQAAHAGFAHGGSGERRLYWKMSVDLSRPLVASMGQHDALDGLAATAALAVRAASEPAGGAPAGESAPRPELHAELRELAAMCEGRRWATADPLGIGGLLTDGLFLARLTGATSAVQERLLVRVLSDAARSLDVVADSHQLEGPAGQRLVFRELGLSLGLAAARRLDEWRRAGSLPGGPPAAAAVQALSRHLPLRERIEAFWLEPAHQEAESWTAHEDINAVMLATSLLPEGYLG